MRMCFSCGRVHGEGPCGGWQEVLVQDRGKEWVLGATFIGPDGKFDKTAYQKEYMRKVRREKRAERDRSK